MPRSAIASLRGSAAPVGAPLTAWSRMAVACERGGAFAAEPEAPTGSSAVPGWLAELERLPATLRDAYTTKDAPDTPPELRRTPEQRAADALVQAAQVALDAGDAPTNGGEKPHIGVLVPLDTLRCGAHHPDGHGVGAGAERTAGPRPDCTCETVPEAGWAGPISKAALDQLVCDSQLTRILVGADGQVLDVGRATRNWSGAQRAAIVARDGGCRFPGCDRPPAWSQIHHLRWWRDGGPTDLDNGLLLCLFHHRTVHLGGWTLRMDPTSREVSATSPRGRTLTSPPRGPAHRHRRRRTS